MVGVALTKPSSQLYFSIIMTLNDIISGVRGLLENRATNLFVSPPVGLPSGTPSTVDTWLDAELAKLIGRRRYWWRKKFFTFTTQANVQIYDLAAIGPNATDFEQMINFYYLPVAGVNNPIGFVENTDEIQTLLNNGQVGPPKKYFNLAGSPLTTVALNPTPDADYVVKGMYWACYVRPTTGHISALSIGAQAGANFVANDTFVIYQGSAWAIGQVTSVAAGGIPTGIALIFGGANFQTANSVATFAASGIGAGLIVNITALSGTTGDVVEVPLIPTQYHYVAMLALLKRILFYLYGENDPRYAATRDELGMDTPLPDGSVTSTGALRLLDDFQSFSQEAEKSRPSFVPQPWVSKPEAEPVPR